MFTYTEMKLAETGSLVETVTEAIQSLHSDTMDKSALQDLLEDVPDIHRNEESCAENILSYHVMALHTLVELLATYEDFNKIYGKKSPPTEGIGSFIHELAECREALCEYFDQYYPQVESLCIPGEEYGIIIGGIRDNYDDAIDPEREPSEPDTTYDNYCFDIMLKYLSLAQAYNGLALNTVRLHAFTERKDKDMQLIHNAGQFNEVSMGHHACAMECWQNLQQKSPHFIKLIESHLATDPVYAAQHKNGGQKPPVYH